MRTPELNRGLSRHHFEQFCEQQEYRILTLLYGEYHGEDTREDLERRRQLTRLGPALSYLERLDLGAGEPRQTRTA
jgi:hypothetical protein